MTIDTKAIRAAAEAAKGLPDGDWNYEPRGQTVWNGSKHMVCDIRGWGYLHYLPDGAELQDAMGQHIANLNPVVVIALLDRLEAAEKALAEPVVETVSDDLRDRLVAISAAIADQDDRAAQAMIRELLSSPPPPAEVPLLSDKEISTEAEKQPLSSSEERHWYGDSYTVCVNNPQGAKSFARAIEALVRQKAGLK